MRLSNRNKTGFYNFLITLAFVILTIGTMMSFFDIIKLPVVGKRTSYGLISIGITMLLVLYLKGRQIFEYDSDGETLNFKNRATIPLLGDELRDEFPKYKLLGYEIVNGIFFKNIYIKISSKKHKESILKYNISYLNKKEIRDLKISLNKTLKNNEENKDN